MYIKTQNGLTVRYSGASLGMTAMLADGWTRYDGNEPPERLQINEDGTVTVLPSPRVTEEWIATDAFVGALYALVPASTVAAVLQDAEQTKSALALIALLASPAAPGCVNLLDARTAQWLSIVGITLDQIRAAVTAQEA